MPAAQPALEAKRARSAAIASRGVGDVSGSCAAFLSFDDTTGIGVTLSASRSPLGKGCGRARRCPVDTCLALAPFNNFRPTRLGVPHGGADNWCVTHGRADPSRSGSRRKATAPTSGGWLMMEEQLR